MDNSEVKVRKGAWTKEEDILLTKCIRTYGEGKWHLVPPRAGLNRCRKSCRMRWLNYLKPNVKRGYFDPAEVDLIQRMHKLLGNRWSLIAGRIPGRTANDVKNFWNTRICKKQQPSKNNNNINIAAQATTNIIIKPRPRNLTISQPRPQPQLVDANVVNTNTCSSSLSSPLLQEQEDDEDRCSRWWEHLLQLSQNGQDGDVAPLSCPANDNLLTDFNKDDDGFMSGLLLDFDAWENIGAPTQFHVQEQ